MRKTTNDKLKSRQKSTFKPLKACVWTAFTNITEYSILHKQQCTTLNFIVINALALHTQNGDIYDRKFISRKNAQYFIQRKSI